MSLISLLVGSIGVGLLFIVIPLSLDLLSEKEKK